jgi:hypothetical protein
MMNMAGVQRAKGAASKEGGDEQGSTDDKDVMRER